MVATAAGGVSGLDNALAGVVAVDKEGEYEGQEEEDAVPAIAVSLSFIQTMVGVDLHDAKRKACLHHGAPLICIQAVRIEGDVGQS